MLGLIDHLRRNGIAYLALFVALGGTSYAAIKLPANSVGSKQLKKNAVTSPKVKDGSLGVQDLSSSTRSALKGDKGAQGAKGDTGPQGPKGDKGDKGDTGATGTVDTSNFYTKAESDTRFRDPLGTAVSLPGVAFHAVGSAELAESFGPGFGIVQPAVGTDPIFWAPLDVPQGATITSLSVNGLDNDASNEIQAKISGIQDGGSADGSILFSVSSGLAFASATYQTFTANAPAGAVVDYTQVAPFVSIEFTGASPQSDLQVGRVTVNYTLP